MENPSCLRDDEGGVGLLVSVQIFHIPNQDSNRVNVRCFRAVVVVGFIGFIGHLRLGKYATNSTGLVHRCCQWSSVR